MKFAIDTNNNTQNFSIPEWDCNAVTDQVVVKIAANQPTVSSAPDRAAFPLVFAIVRTVPRMSWVNIASAASIATVGII